LCVRPRAAEPELSDHSAEENKGDSAIGADLDHRKKNGDYEGAPGLRNKLYSGIHQELLASQQQTEVWV